MKKQIKIVIGMVLCIVVLSVVMIALASKGQNQKQQTNNEIEKEITEQSKSTTIKAPEIQRESKSEMVAASEESTTQTTEEMSTSDSSTEQAKKSVSKNTKKKNNKQNKEIKQKKETATTQEKTTEKLENEDVTQEVKTTEASTTTQVKPVKEEKVTCSLSISCANILNNLDQLKEAKKDYVPPKGSIYSGSNIEFKAGESVFEVVQRVTTNEKIPLDYIKSTTFHTVYIKGIGNLYEKDCGTMSGWIYKVNGVSPSKGCSDYKLAAGDVISFVYTCDGGKDVKE